MADRTGIEWTDATWNPVRGCSRVSAGCQHCYAERVAARFCGPGQPYEGLIHPSTKGWNGKVRLLPEALQIPWRWTLFVTGPVMRQWGFHCPDKGWRHWKEFTAEGKPGEIGPGCD